MHWTQECVFTINCMKTLQTKLQEVGYVGLTALTLQNTHEGFTVSTHWWSHTNAHGLSPHQAKPHYLVFRRFFFFFFFGLWICFRSVDRCHPLKRWIHPRPVNKEFIWFHWTRRVTGEVWQDWSVRIDTLDHIWHNYYISFLRGLSLVSLIAFISNQSTKPVDGWCIVSVLHLRQRPVWWSLGGPRSVDVVEVLKNPVQ